uniref:c-SKI SMAD4-binding domain-containing protein n=1 Tax=Trichobilharzia regenti TaxID=157069 RepID=A0AA85IKX0_TRIRE|nr:unnamed protein product [Trichobilharzia regenti]
MDLSLYNPQSNSNNIMRSSTVLDSQHVNSDINHNWAQFHSDSKNEVRRIHNSENPPYSNFIFNMHHFEVDSYAKQLNLINTSKVNSQIKHLNEPIYATKQYNNSDNDNKDYNSSNSSTTDTRISKTSDDFSGYPSKKNESDYDHLYTIKLRNQTLVCLNMNGVKRLCLAQISSTLLRQYSYNEIHNRRVALGITCVQCTPNQLELLREAGAMPTSSRRCGTITYREAERLIKSFLDEPEHPKLPENFVFQVMHHCGWGCQGAFSPSRYNSSRAKCIRCYICQNYFSPNKFIFHCHSPRSNDDSAAKSTYRHPDAANFNAWRRHLYLLDPDPPVEVIYAWEDVKAMFNGGNRKRNPMIHTSNNTTNNNNSNNNISSNDSVHDFSSMNETPFTMNELAANSTPNLEHDYKEVDSEQYKQYLHTKKWDDESQSNGDESSSDLCDPDRSIKSTVQQEDSPTKTKRPKLNFMIENMVKNQPKRKTTRKSQGSKLNISIFRSHKESADCKPYFPTNIQNNDISHEEMTEIVNPNKSQKVFNPIEIDIYNFTRENLNKNDLSNAVEEINIPNNKTQHPYALSQPGHSYPDEDITAFFLNTWPSLLLFKHLLYGSENSLLKQTSSECIPEMKSSFKMNNLSHSANILNLSNTQDCLLNATSQEDSNLNNCSLISDNIAFNANRQNSLNTTSLTNFTVASPQVNPKVNRID